MTVLLLLLSTASSAGLFYLTGLYTEWYWYFIPVLMVPVLYLLLFGVHVLLAGAVGLLFVRKKKPVKKPNAYFYRITVSSIRQLILLARIKVTVKGQEKLPDRDCLFVYNHRSDFDPLLLGTKIPFRRVALVSKPENEKIPVAGRYMHAAGYLTINRTSPRQALKTVAQCAEWISEGVASVAISPEGTRSRTGKLLPFRAAPFSVAKKAACPMVVVVFKGTENVKKNFPFRRTHVEMNICQVLLPEDYSAMTSVELAGYVRDIYLKALGEESVEAGNNAPESQAGQA